MALNTKFDEYLDFPCDFPFKVLGLADERLPDLVVAVVQEHAPGDYTPTIKPSSKGNYHSVSIRVTVTSKEHIETLYTALGDIDIVKGVL
ncbi:DUF493 family protein YbeD [Motilimonas pumila]|uniref:UPF0250 protein D1Z90_00440 n=1 Tax=Motilimonas pumila TaxID=2303987 RepID=A0A418YJT1_9GAMM|nr:DUF493 family protein YbeD [Motilimonas pumila]RJG51238.1 DUF493 family protein [Motilimonas pumila]